MNNNHENKINMFLSNLNLDITPQCKEYAKDYVIEIEKLKDALLRFNQQLLEKDKEIEKLKEENNLPIAECMLISH